MGINVNMDYSTLFSSMSGASSSNNYLSGLTGMLSDYSSIKNGSYGKLVSAYYKKVGNDGSSSKTDDSKDAKSSELSKSQQVAAEKKKYSSIASNANALEESAEKLTNSGTDSIFEKTWKATTDEDGNKAQVFDYNTDKIVSAVSDFVTKYNSLVSAASDASDSTTSTRASYMEKITNSFKDELSSIGISVSDKGKLSLDKDKMKEAGMESVKNILGSRSGYAYQMSSSASSLESAASRAASNSSTYSKTGSVTPNYSSIMDSFI
ncbi:flagellar filament capping protein FliD [Butyrivibrio sp. WCD3002]|uniref:flagellar filament capping protein FliD n=1 Tax=Butyrivibrio sp. WCD3002 TaxID=1280676 RepID=UPI00041254E2|nr:flagellar filament capping protein FliD [Butyrivibrio sp. WCD3002]